MSSVILLVIHTLYVGSAATNVVRSCGPTYLLIFDFISNEICLNRKPRRLFFSGSLVVLGVVYGYFFVILVRYENIK